MSSEFSEKCLNKELLIKSTIIAEGINDENRQFGTTVLEELFVNTKKIS